MTENDPLDDVNIQHIKLSDGSEIISYINGFEGAMIIMERPMILNLAMTAGGNDTYFFTRYMQFAKNTLIKVNSRNVISSSEVRNDIKEKYIQAAVRSETHEESPNNNYEREIEQPSDDELDLNYMEPISKKLH